MGIIQVLEPCLECAAKRELATKRASKVEGFQPGFEDTIGENPRIVHATQEVLIAVVESVLTGGLDLQMEILLGIRAGSVQERIVGNVTTCTITGIGFVAEDKLVVNW
jgi:hypothetical protein